MRPIHMKQTGFYGQTVRRFLHLEHEPPSSITRSLRNAEVAVTETRDDAPVRSLSGEMGLEDAYVVSLKLNDYPSCELWERGNSVTKADIRAGATYLYDMKNDPQIRHQQAVPLPPFLSSALGARRHRCAVRRTARW